MLRQASDRGLGVREQVAGERPEGESSGPLRWWLNTTQGQVFGGAVASVEGGRLDYVAVTGEPRFDRAVGTGIDACDIGLDVLHAQFIHRVIAQQSGKLRCVEMISVVQRVGVLRDL